MLVWFVCILNNASDWPTNSHSTLESQSPSLMQLSRLCPLPAKLKIIIIKKTALQLRRLRAESDVNSFSSFLGFAGYYRRFIQDNSKIVKPLNNLTAGYPTLRKRTAVSTSTQKSLLEGGGQTTVSKLLKQSLIVCQPIAY